MKLSSIRSIFLDRDGVINRRNHTGYVKSWNEFHLFPVVPRALRHLNDQGCRVIVITNQRGISLGLYTEDDLHRIYSRLNEVLAKHDAWIDRFYFCPHGTECIDCRKPNIGMIHRAMKEFQDITPQASVMIGDSITDVQAGQNAGMHTIMMRNNENAHTSDPQPTAFARNLLEAVKLLGTWKV